MLCPQVLWRRAQVPQDDEATSGLQMVGCGRPIYSSAEGPGCTVLLAAFCFFKNESLTHILTVRVLIAELGV